MHKIGYVVLYRVALCRTSFARNTISAPLSQGFCWFFSLFANPQNGYSIRAAPEQSADG
jgi:hypothetical protein